MPDLAGNIEEIQNSLKASLGRGHDTLDKNVVAASKRVLLQSVDFKPASAPYSLQCNALKAKYTLLNPSSTSPNKSAMWNGKTEQYQKKPEGSKDMNKVTTEGGGEESLPRPKVILYPDELIKMEWTARTPSRIGAGLVNMGNTCFFNSTLQCLTYTAPLVNYCMTGDHRQKCKKNGFCMMCEIQSHIRTSLDCGGRSIKPHSMLQKLRCIAKHMKWGRQEDAHEFLRFVVDHLQQSCLNGGENKLDRHSKETTVINQIFGGYLRSQVTCLRCQAKSNTFDPFMDLSLDIKGVNTVEDALAKFVKPETLENENAYKCPKCRNKVRAHKRFSIQKPPNVLTLQLNRFDFSRHLSGKINRFIKYPERINLRNFMSQRQGEPILYHLYGVLVHSGHSSDCGHYYSYVKSPSKTWYCMNDSMVHQANYQSVLHADAYVLFYARVNRSSSSTPSTPKSDGSKSSLTSSKNSFIGPVLPSHMAQNKSPLTNGVHGKPSSELGTPVQRGQKNSSSSTPSSTPKIVTHAASSLPDSHRKISFPILTAQQKKLQQQAQDEQEEDGKRIVLQIKHGNSTTMVKSPDGKSKVVNGTISTLPWDQMKTGLVPYNDDDDSDSEQENKSSQSTSHSSSSKIVNSSVSLMKKLAQDQHNNNNGSKLVPSSGVKNSLAHKNNSLPNGSGDNNLTSHKNQHSEKKLSASSLLLSPPSSKTAPFVWDSSPSPTKSSTFNANNKISDSQSDSQQYPSPPPTISSSNFHKDRQKHNPSSHNSSSLVSPSKSSGGKPNLALDMPNTSVSKVKGCGGTWYIHPHEGAPSPRGSNSSTNSVNSTSEWSVETKKGNGTTKHSKDSKDVYHPLALNFGSTKSSNGKLSGQSSTDSSLKHKTVSSNINNKPSVLPGKTQHTPLTVSKKSFPSSATESQSKFLSSRDGNVTPVDISDKQSLLSPASSQSSESSSKKLSKKLKSKKRKQQSLSREGSNSSPSEDESTSKKSLKKKKNKNKKYKKEDKKRLISDSDQEDSDTNTVSNTSKHKKHKREKGERKKYSKSESDSSSSDSDRVSSHQKKSKSKNRKQTSSSRDSESSSEEGYEWVEKTIESPLTKGKVNQVCVQSWNHSVKGDLSTSSRDKEEGVAKSKKAKTTATWDGARQSKVDKEFTGNNLHYKNQVLSWDGGKSQLSKDLEEDRQASRKRHWSDEYNEELDAGKVKKVKNPKQDAEFGSSYNPFQEYHHYKKNSHREDEEETSWSQDHSYSHRRDHHYDNNSSSSNRTNGNHSRHSSNWYDNNKSYHKASYNSGGGSKFNGNRRHFK